MCSLPYPVPILLASLSKEISFYSFAKLLLFLCLIILFFPHPLPAAVPSRSTHLPLGKPQVHLSSALGLQSLLLFQRAADDARSDGDVAVVAVPGAESVSIRMLQESVALRAAGADEVWDDGTYVIPAAFHAKTIVTEFDVLCVEVRGVVWCSVFNGASA